MQSLDVISINIWQMLISLCNLVLLFLLLKHFLYKPVKKMLDKRQQKIDDDLNDASEAKRLALEEKQEYDERLASAHQKAQDIIKDATVTADRRGAKLVDEAQQRADGIVRQAKTQAELEIKKAQAGIKTEIIDVSALIASKLLQREINPNDHKELIDSCIDKIGDVDDSNG